MKTKMIIVLTIICSIQSFGQTVGQVFYVGGMGYLLTSPTEVQVTDSNPVTLVGDLIVSEYVSHNDNRYRVVAIGDFAFSECINLTSISLPNIDSIGEYAFIECSRLNTVSIPNSVSYIGGSAFSNCTNLTTIVLPTNLNTIAPGTFANCTSLTSINIPFSVTSIGGGAFQFCLGLTSINIPLSVNNIGAFAFRSCLGLTSMTIPNSVSIINRGTFQMCRNLSSISISNSLTTIGDDAFEHCTSLTSFTMPNSVTSIGNLAFYNCNSLTSISLPSSVTSIGSGAFAQCNNLSSVFVSWPIPLTINRDVFDRINLAPVTLYVPVGTEAVYDAAPVWTEFGIINDPLPLYTSISDNNFEQALFDQGIDTVNGDNRVLTNAIVNLTTLNVSNKAIADLSGIENFRSLIELNCGNNNLRNLNISSLVWLEKLNCNNNLIGTLDLNSLTSLKELNCDNNQLTQLKINSISNLERISCSSNRLTNLDLTSHLRLQKLYCAFNQLNSLNLTGLLFLEELVCTNNHLSSLNLSDARLQILFCGNNPLTSLNLTNQGASLRIFHCDNSFLNQMDLRGFTLLTDFNCTANPYLNCISVDDVAYANAQYQKDTTASFNNDCFGPLTVTNCQNTAAVPLVSPYASGVVSNWYSSAVGGRPILTAPTPSTSTVGSRIFYVSQVWAGVESRRIAITVNTLGIPAAPAGITGVAAQGALVGTTTPATYAVAPVANATVYNWTVPAGVNIVSGQGTNTLTVNFSNVPAGAGPIGNLMVVAQNAQGCSTRLARILTLTKALPVAPTAIRMTDAAFAIPIAGIPTAITNISRFIGTSTVLTLTATPVTGVTTYEWELPVGANVLSGATVTRGGASGSNVITLNFEGVSPSSMFNFTTASGLLTHVLRVGVKSVTGVGASVTNNAALINPATTSTARLLTLTATSPRAAGAIRMTDALAADSTRAITNISTLIGTNKELTLTATPSATATGYTWELPKGVKQLSGGTSNVITINFADVASGTTSLYLGVKSINGAGESVTSNTSLIPATSSTARLLRLSATLPGTVPAVMGQVVGICGKNAYTYTISPSALATSYQVSAPAGAIITSKSKESNKSNLIHTSDLEFMVTYPEKFFTTKQTPASVAVWAMNGVGQSATARILNVSSSIPKPTDLSYKKGKGRHRLTVSDEVRDKLKRTSGLHKEIHLNEQDNGFTYIWSVSDGVELISGQGTSSIEIDYSTISPNVKSIKVSMYLKNNCGVVSLPVTTIILLEPTTTTTKTAETLTIEATEVYPNPVDNDFTIDVTASKLGTLDIAIYSLEGIQVVDSKTFALKEGANTITQNVSNLAKGIYIVQLLNSSNNEVNTKKLIKN